MPEPQLSVTYKGLMGILVTLSALAALFTTIFTQMVVPNILLEAGKMIDAKMQVHGDQVHPAGVRRDEFTSAISRLESKIDLLLAERRTGK